MELIHDTLNPAGLGQQGEFTEWMRGAQARFIGAKRLEDGSYAGVVRLINTHAICLGVTPGQPFQKRFCFEDISACLHEYSQLKSSHDEPSGWVARRPKLLAVPPFTTSG